MLEVGIFETAGLNLKTQAFRNGLSSGMQMRTACTNSRGEFCQ